MSSSRIRLILIACVTTSLLVVTLPPALAIVIVIGSASRIPFSNAYPEDARQQVRQALDSRDCQFIGGSSSMQVTTLSFAGDTASLNEQLDLLSKCPSAKVQVSFDARNSKSDWRVTHRVKNHQFEVVVSLKSERIVLEQLVIPPAKGPEL